ncbi:DUF3955 domain-containing protein [Flavobacteriaceae bacterium]|nr:DUF3955 domain-containing protein [Flavobacteriaceae bacterium]MDA9866177.1 DUF3955 domain-containing protein [Flavobacteriaceae bacterium]MDB4014218.1 DUF3955 domain-containing protein [Flavobacteriaceae bacterium]MDB4240139.1 DUF3955 domain-containing protein [Flavobacteriaceae bacterium]
MRKKLPLILFLISLSCYLLFFLIGSEIDENGYLDEPFFLLPLGALFFFASSMFFAWNKIKGL